MPEKYKLPKEISNEMGGKGDILDRRMSQIFELLSEAPTENLHTFLDIGMGQGQVLKYFSKKGKKCTGIGLEIDSYSEDIKSLEKIGIAIREGDAEKLPFADNSFDCVIMSHILEHCQNTGTVLKEARRVLAKNGWLLVFVPPYDSRVCAGHVNTGWNIGQLMYVLLLNGFNVKNGKFIRYGYNITAFVQKDESPTLQLRGDSGDISILSAGSKWPAPIKTKKGDNDGFYGDITSVNWDTESAVIKKLQNEFEGNKIKKYFFNIIFSATRKAPVNVRLKLANFFFLLSKTLKKDIAERTNDTINPKIFKG